MLTEVRAGEWTFRGVSVGSVYTSILVPELGLLLDAGIALRSLARFDHVFLSHGHIDHVGALMPALSMRSFVRRTPVRIYAPKELVPSLQASMEAACAVHPCDHAWTLEGLCPGDERDLFGDWFVRAFRTHHNIPSLGYLFGRRVQKLREAFAGLGEEEIVRRRREGDDSMLEVVGRREIAWAGDSLATVLETAPEVLDAKVLLLECSFVGGERTLEDARARTHVHLDELIERADRFDNEAVILMHFSQVHEPAEVHRVIRERLPPELLRRVKIFAPGGGPWFG